MAAAAAAASITMSLEKDFIFSCNRAQILHHYPVNITWFVPTGLAQSQTLPESSPFLEFITHFPEPGAERFPNSLILFVLSLSLN